MEQDLLENLIIESIQIYGHGIYYLPRTIIRKDDLYGEDTLSEYNDAYHFETYIKSYDAFEGDGTFLSKFNLEIRDQVTLTMARRTFHEEVTGQNGNIIRPREGDLIYSTMIGKLFVIKYVNNYPVFFQMGTLQTWDCVCEQFEYSNERFDTGIAEIDKVQGEFSFAVSDFSLLTSSGEVIVADDGFPIVLSSFNFDEQLVDVLADNDEINEEGLSVVDWSDRDPFSEVIE